MNLNPFSPEWPKEMADLVDRVAHTIRSKFTARAVTATNAVVFGLVAVFAALVAATVGIVIAIRSVQAYLWWEPETVGLWVLGSLTIIGLVLAIVGMASSNPAVTWTGWSLFVVAGGRWALAAADVHIDHDTAVWLSYLIVGGVFLLIGTVVMSKRHSPLEAAA